LRPTIKSLKTKVIIVLIDLDIVTSCLLRNAVNIVVVFLQGVVFAIIIYSLKAKYVTIPKASQVQQLLIKEIMHQ
jgi:hypothetical protein